MIYEKSYTCYLFTCLSFCQSIRDVPMITIEADEEFETSPVRKAAMLLMVREFIAKL